jgi:hypothetical protein
LPATALGGHQGSVSTWQGPLNQDQGAQPGYSQNTDNEEEQSQNTSEDDIAEFQDDPINKHRIYKGHFSKPVHNNLDDSFDDFT